MLRPGSLLYLAVSQLHTSHGACGCDSEQWTEMICKTIIKTHFKAPFQHFTAEPSKCRKFSADSQKFGQNSIRVPSE